MSDTPSEKNAPKIPPQSNPPPGMNLPPNMPNPYMYPYQYIPPPTCYSTPPPMPFMAYNPAFPYPMNIPPSCPPYRMGPPISHTTADAALKKYSFGDDRKLDKYFPNCTNEPGVVSKVKIWEASRVIKRYYRLLKELEEEYERINSDDVSIDSEICQNIASKREELISCRKFFEKDPDYLICLKYKINRRKKKRIYRKKARKSKSHVHIYEIASEHMQKLQQEASKIKQEEKLKQEADNILSDVMQKKSDARYQIQLLNSLLKLHSARVHQLTVETNFTPDVTISGFEKVLEKLLNLWESKLREYTIEENGLKLMIKELAVNAEDENVEKLKINFDKWLELMFGTSDLKSNLFYYNYDQLIAIRQGWDKYVVDHDDPGGSKIPAGWVVPKYNENDSWNKFLSH